MARRDRRLQQHAVERDAVLVDTLVTFDQVDALALGGRIEGAEVGEFGRSQLTVGHAGTLLAGTIVTETIFSWPGIGRLTVQAISSRDYPLLQGCILVIALSYVVVNLLTDVLYSVIDPRVRLS